MGWSEADFDGATGGAQHDKAVVFAGTFTVPVAVVFFDSLGKGLDTLYPIRWSRVGAPTERYRYIFPPFIHEAILSAKQRKAEHTGWQMWCLVLCSVP
jgi:hypothetical protein|mmetsp:Transcript_11574/g.19571  ORF Transcript_11574/g.19571 Transcript_11574/m.19571 type:complete len:98 (+) Transcript_11574:526-819(+)